jgi:hypothetical protein
MLSLSPNLILIPFIIYLVVHFFFALINVKHLFRIGALTFTSFVFTSAFVVYTLLILGGTWAMVGDFDWSKPINIDFDQTKFNGENF